MNFSPEQVEIMRGVIRQGKGRNVVFRRVSSVRTIGFQRARLYENENEYTTIGEDKLSGLTYDQYERLEVRCRHFTFRTTSAKMRDEPSWIKDKCLFGSNARYSPFDPVRFRFTDLALRTTVVPREGDLICGLVDKKVWEAKRKEGKTCPPFTHWFICSDQFLHAWTLMMYDEHAAFRAARPVQALLSKEHSKEELERAIRKWYMSGNRLTTNAWRKRGLARVERTPDQYHRLRVEPCAINQCHMYAAMVLAVRWGERCTPENVPTTHGLPPLDWDIPPDFQREFVQNLLDGCGSGK